MKNNPPPEQPLIDVVLDFETFYDSKVNLSKMTTPEYVMHKEFEIIGFSMQIGGRPPRWYTSHLGLEHYKMLLVAVPWERVRLICHNVMFDASILYWRFGIKPAQYFCTMQGARKDIVAHSGSMSLKAVAKYLNLGEKGTEVVAAHGKHLKDFTGEELSAYGEYCVQDVKLCSQIYHHLKPMFSEDEELMLHLTCRKAIVPQARWGRDVLTDALLEEQLEKRRILKTVAVDKKVLMSNPQFAAALVAAGVEPPTKISPTTGKVTLAFAKSDLEFQALRNHESPTVRGLVEARLGVKSTLMESRLERLAAVADALDGNAVFPLLYYGAHTGRLSGSDKINMQNFPPNSAPRSALTAPPEYYLVAGDLSQVEARVTAWLAGCSLLLDQYRNGDDVYSRFAETLYEMEPGSVTKLAHPGKRFMGKTCILGLGFGLGGPNFATQVSSKGVPTSEDEGKKIVRTYRQTFPEIVKLWYRMNDMLEIGARGGSMSHKCLTMNGSRLELPGGRYIEYPELYKDGQGEFWYRGNQGKWIKIYGAKMTENAVQALAQILIRDAELKLARKKVYAVGQVHDELIYSIRQGAIESFSRILEKVLRMPPEWAPDLPLDCEVSHGLTYSDCK